MLEDAVIVGVVMVLVGIVKLIAVRAGASEETIKQIIVPLAVLGLAGALNVAAAYVWQPDLFWREALKQGIALGAVAAGVYGLGKAALGKS
ncbi:MAG: hypothetical protein ACM359_12365 [Bacillota bacterium]